MERYIEYEVLNENLPANTGQILRRKIGLSSKQISRLKFRKNGICVNGIPARVNQELKAEDRICICLESEEDGSLQLEAVPGAIEICYEDDDLCIVNKEAGVTVHPSHGHYSDTLANHLVAYYRKLGQEIRVRPVGRLDRDTSGLVLFAKNQVAAARLSESGKMAVQKEYQALVEGCVCCKENSIDKPIKASENHLNRMMITDDGKPAVTHYKVIKTYDGYSLVKLWLEHGRTHQIRVHMASIGHPLLGDEIYGKQGEPGRTALHCGKIKLKQPFTGEEIEVIAPLPVDMERMINDGTIEL